MIIEVRVKSSSSEASFVKLSEPTVYIARVTQPAVDGKANDAVLEAVAHNFGVPKSRVILKRGQRSKIKLFEIPNLSFQE